MNRSLACGSIWNGCLTRGLVEECAIRWVAVGVAAAAVLAGCGRVAIGDWIADAPQHILKVVGASVRPVPSSLGAG